MGATEIVALDLNEPAVISGNGSAISEFVEQLMFMVIQRQVCLETELAAAEGGRVHHIALRSAPPIPVWDFSSYQALIERGYQIAAPLIAYWANTSEPEFEASVALAEQQFGRQLM